MTTILNFFQHIPEFLQLWATNYGMGLYFILAAILFAETGLVVTPLLPGDSLLFATGAFISMGFPGFDLLTMAALMITAVFCGDMVNYHVGKWVGPKVFNDSYNSRWLNKKNLNKTHAFYQRHGGKTVILARFVPIVRTYAPFVAGLGAMTFKRFAVFSICGAILWVGSFLSLGYFFGNVPGVKSNFHYVIMAVLVISVLPIVFEVIRSRVFLRKENSKSDS